MKQEQEEQEEEEEQEKHLRRRHLWPVTLNEARGWGGGSAGGAAADPFAPRQ